MKNHRLLNISIPLVYLSVLTLLIAFIGFNPEEENQKASEMVLAPETHAEAREDITFILGEDQKQQNPYYTRATQYYSNHPEDHTEYLIDSCRTLVDVRNHLLANPPQNGRPWGQINLVVHGNPWLGMSCRVAPGTRRASRNSLREAIEADLFPPLPDGLIDANSRLMLQSCGLGQDPELLEIVAEAFRSVEKPQVSSPEHFVSYTFANDVGRLERSLVRPSHIVLPGRLEELPSSEFLSEKFVRKYPHEVTDWAGALSRKQAGGPDQTYMTTFRVPVIWTVTYPSKASRPDLSHPADQEAWIMEQPELARTLAEIGIPSGEFEWKFEKVLHWIDTENFEPAIKATGWCTIVCVLEKVGDSENNLLAVQAKNSPYSSPGALESGGGA